MSVESDGKNMTVKVTSQLVVVAALRNSYYVACLKEDFRFLEKEIYFCELHSSLPCFCHVVQCPKLLRINIFLLTLKSSQSILYVMMGASFNT